MGSVYFHGWKTNCSCDVSFGSLYAWDYLIKLVETVGPFPNANDRLVDEDANQVAYRFGQEESAKISTAIIAAIPRIPNRDNPIKPLAEQIMPDYPAGELGEMESVYEYWRGRADELRKLAEFFALTPVEGMLDC